MSDDRFHFKIPITNVRIEKFEKTGGGNHFQRENHTEHGKKLYNSTIKLKEIECAKKDFKLTNDLFFQIETQLARTCCPGQIPYDIEML